MPILDRSTSLAITFAAITLLVPSASPQQSAIDLPVSTLPRIGTVSDRFQSYNIEMLEVTGGRFWKPYAATSSHSESGSSSAPSGMNPDMYAYRPPESLSNPRLRKLAAALGPAYVRVSGTWANSIYFPKPGESITSPPAGFGSVLTPQEWKGVVDFSRAADAEIVTSFATSVGTRDAQGTWTPDQAARFLDYNHSVHGQIAAAEFMNEPTFAIMGGAPKGYDAQQFGRDFHIFEAFIRAHAPGIKIAGPGSVGETTDASQSLGAHMPGFIPTPALLAAMGPNTVDIFSYHAYAGASQRCTAMGVPQTTAETALSEQWLSRTDEILAYYEKLRDQFDPGKSIWLTETAETACGGNPWSSTFLDTFRYLDQLGRLAKQHVQVVMHNTLDASDYGLLQEGTYVPRPNFWAALLWHKLMGTTVLDAGIPTQPGLHVYAHCLRDAPGGVAVLVIQTDKQQPRTLHIPAEAERYTLSSTPLQSDTVDLNGRKLTLAPNDELPRLDGVSVHAGSYRFDPATITFLAVPHANNPACH